VIDPAAEHRKINKQNFLRININTTATTETLRVLFFFLYDRAPTKISKICRNSKDFSTPTSEFIDTYEAAAAVITIN